MTDAAPSEPAPLPGFTVERYFALVEEGLLAEDDRVELLEGVVVAMSPRNARHDAAVTLVQEALRTALGTRAVIRVQCTLILGPYLAPEPDVAVVPGVLRDYDTRHPTAALLVVEVGDSSLPQDRITKVRTYAGAGIPEYWIVNLRDDEVEVHRMPDPTARTYRERHVTASGDRIDLIMFPDVSVVVADLLPTR